MNEISIETVLLQLLVLFLLAKVAGLLCERIKVSPVIGEIFAGVLVGNTILYQWLSLDIDLTLFQVLSELGVIFLLFAVGLETPFSELRKVGRTAMQVAVLGVMVPLLSGFALIMALGHGQTEALFIAAALVATSVGITARVIKDMNQTQAIESRIIIGAAVIDDVLGMIVLAIVVGIASGGSGPLDIILVSVEGILFVLMVIFIGSILVPHARKKIAIRNGLKNGEDQSVKQKRHGISPLPLAIIVCLALSFAASFVGLAAIIGAFLAGMAFAEFRDMWPVEEDFHPINEFLVPFFFLFVGISINLGSFGDVLIIAVLVTLLAVATKFIGCGLGARKLGEKSATIIGVGMVPRGEVGIIVASIGLSMAVISTSMFSVVVFMSMATTIIAPPLLTWAFRRKLRDASQG